MDNDCVNERERLHPGWQEANATINQNTCWAWLYELRPPSPGELFNCFAGGLPHARLIQAATNPDTPFDDTDLFDSLQSSGDTEAACAATVLGMNSVIESGRDFREFNSWLIRIDQLLTQPDLSILGRGALLMQTAIAQLLGPGQLGDVVLTLEEFGSAAECADSNAQRIVCASLRGYCELMAGRLMVADAIVRDAAYISPEADSHPFPKIHLQACQGLINTLRNKLNEAQEGLSTLVASPAFEHLPSSLWLIGMGHRLLSLAVANDQPADLEAIADSIRARSIPSHKHYHRSYTHYALGAAALLTGQPETALFHAETAIEMAKRCRSTVAERTATLLAIQALADLGQHERALNWLAACSDGWNKAGANLLTASGALEEAHLNLELGRLELAHRALDRARAALPIGEPLPCNLRRQEFVAALLTRLSPPPTPNTAHQPDPRPVQITTFGELCVEINGRRLYDRDWHGTRTKTLLKALIVLGGYKVSADHLCDMLWPDADGDVARNNLKVALWRLRHLGCKKGEAPVPWVVIQHGHVSLVGGLCRIDCIEFKANLKAAQENRDPIRLCTALHSLTDHFLAADDSESWIIDHREILKRAYLRGIHAMLETASPEAISNNLPSVLETALRLNPNDRYLHQLASRLNPNSM